MRLKSDEVRALSTWIFTWVFLANACFMALWFVGSPPRYGEIVVIAFVGMIVTLAPVSYEPIMPGNAGEVTL